MQFRQYFTDGHGDVTALADEDGYICQSYSYDAFGNLTSGGTTGANRFLYASEYYDTELGTYYLRMRYYEPRTGVFFTEDPARDGLNWYSYCAANPVCYVDPWGENPIIPLLVIVAIGFFLSSCEQTEGRSYEILQGEDMYPPTNATAYSTEEEAVEYAVQSLFDYFDKNYKEHPDEEVEMGITIVKTRGYYYASSIYFGTSNSVSIESDNMLNYHRVAFVHTHPYEMGEGAWFSKEDIDLYKDYSANGYVFSPRVENCRLFKYDYNKNQQTSLKMARTNK